MPVMADQRNAETEDITGGASDQGSAVVSY